MSMFILPPPPGVCRSCARDHDPGQPHDKQSLQYQYTFRSEHGRWPTWKDAIAHCDRDTQIMWEDALRERGYWDGWEGEFPPAPDVAPTPGFVGTVTKFMIVEGEQE